MWGPADAKAFRSALAARQLAAPRIFLAGPIIDGSPPIWPHSVAVSTVEEARRAVIEQKRQGVDFDPGGVGRSGPGQRNRRVGPESGSALAGRRAWCPPKLAVGHRGRRRQGRGMGPPDVGRIRRRAVFRPEREPSSHLRPGPHDPGEARPRRRRRGQGFVHSVRPPPAVRGCGGGHEEPGRCGTSLHRRAGIRTPPASKRPGAGNPQTLTHFGGRGHVRGGVPPLRGVRTERLMGPRCVAGSRREAGQGGPPRKWPWCRPPEIHAATTASRIPGWIAPKLRSAVTRRARSAYQDADAETMLRIVPGGMHTPPGTTGA